MPSSFVDSYAPIVKLLIEQTPQRVLDIGPGWGKFGLACREYLPDLQILDCVEVPQGLLEPQRAIYDTRFISDIRSAEQPLFADYDLVLLIDVIEHMPKPDGHELLERIRQAGPRVLIATPKVFVEQHDEHNPYEDHHCVWSWEDFDTHPIEADVSTIDAIIYLLKGA